MDFKEFLLAFGQDWVTLMSGIASVALTIIGVAKKWEKVPNWAFWLAASVCFVFASARVWTVQHRARVELESIRPYVLIEELSPAQIRAMALKNSKNPALPEGAYDRAYVTAVSPSSEFLLYNYRLLGKVPAKNIRHYERATTTGDGPEREIKLPSSKTTASEAMLPDQQPLTRSVEFPSGTLVTGLPNENRKLRIRLLITYTGELSNKNVYFYKVVLISGRFSTVEDMNRSFQGIVIESTDEGIVNNLDDLMK